MAKIVGFEGPFFLITEHKVIFMDSVFIKSNFFIFQGNEQFVQSRYKRIVLSKWSVRKITNLKTKTTNIKRDGKTVLKSCYL